MAGEDGMDWGVFQLAESWFRVGGEALGVITRVCRHAPT